MKKNPIKTMTINVGLLVASSLVAFGAGELIVRVLYKDTVTLMPRYHTDAEYGEFTLRKIRPNSVFWHTTVDGSWEFLTNASGFRNTEDFDYEKPEGILRVISLGDSHTQGYEVRQEHTYSAVIERFLERQGYNVQVINTGVSGFGTAEALIFLENEGIKYRPDAVVLGFYANDFEDNLKAGIFRLNPDGSLSIEKQQHIPGVRVQNLIYSLPLVPWLSEHSYFYSLLFNNVWKYFKARRKADAIDAVTEYAIPTTDHASNYQIELATALIQRMYEFSRNHGIPLIIMDIPRISGDHSLAQSMLDKLPEMSDGFVDGSSLLADYLGVAEIHVPHGARHISEFTHTVLGLEAAKQIELQFLARTTPEVAPQLENE
jgi:lysophospholipase L1-like esterase